MSRGRILVVDDEDDILELTKYNLTWEDYEVVCSRSGEEATDAARATPFDLVVLDLTLPGLDGLDVCRILKSDSETAGLLVLMLTARDGEADIVSGLELGADDYMTKPFSPRVLLARVKVLLRRRGTATPWRGETIRIEELVIDPDRFEVRIKDRRVPLTRAEFGLLRLLARRPGRVFSRDQIIESVHGDNYYVTDRAVDVLVLQRQKVILKTKSPTILIRLAKFFMGCRPLARFGD